MFTETETFDQFKNRLEREGLRPATFDESGWYYVFINADGYRDSIWVTNINIKQNQLI